MKQVNFRLLVASALILSACESEPVPDYGQRVDPKSAVTIAAAEAGSEEPETTTSRPYRGSWTGDELDVIAVYELVLGRFPDKAGLEYWVDEYDSAEDVNLVVYGLLWSEETDGLLDVSEPTAVLTLVDRLLGPTAGPAYHEEYVDLALDGRETLPEIGLAIIRDHLDLVNRRLVEIRERHAETERRWT